MINRSIGLRSIMAVMGMLAGGCASDSSIGSSVGESSSGSAMTTVSANNIERVASGAVEDSQNACMELIPKGASAGRGMLVEESSRRDQTDRR